MQNVVVELSYNVKASISSKVDGSSLRKAAYAGWSGMPSRRKPVAVALSNNFGRGASGTGRSSGGTEVLEIDSKFGQLLGLSEGQLVRLEAVCFPLCIVIADSSVDQHTSSSRCTLGSYSFN